MLKKVLFPALAAIILVGGISLVSAKNGMGLMMELRNNVHDYAKKEVFPSLTQWKSELDNAMTKEDLAKLNDLRAKAKELRNGMKAKMMSDMASMDPGKERRKEMKSDMKETHKAMMDLMQDVKPLAEKYKPALDQIAQKAEPKIKTWKDNFKNIMTKWHEAHKDELKDMKDKRGGMMHPGMMMRMFRDFPAKDKDRMAAMFMLWDGSDDLLMGGAGMHDRMDERMVATNKYPSADLPTATNSPNPFTEKTTISFTNPATQHVKINVNDGDGRLVKTLYDGEMKGGDNTVDFIPTDKMTPGVYIYEITAGSRTISGKMIYNK